MGMEVVHKTGHLPSTYRRRACSCDMLCLASYVQESYAFRRGRCQQISVRSIDDLLNTENYSTKHMDNTESDIAYQQSDKNRDGKKHKPDNHSKNHKQVVHQKY